MTENPYIVGSAWTSVEDSTDLQLDKEVFETCSAAPRDGGVRRHQVCLSVTGSLDLCDARSISIALTRKELRNGLRVRADERAAAITDMKHLEPSPETP
jgi:hypothetical protein